ncbi:MAG TPA: hypothetical protein VME46_01195 [Acidimicrobiales bacterium]|nr:hypothetical protein [Acidimicrobiales bacterium]
MPPNYREQQGHPLQPHERKGFVVLAAVVVAIAGGTWAYEAASGPSAGKGKCLSVSIPSSTGGAYIHECGAAARQMCAAEAVTRGPLASQIVVACRDEGFLSPKRR